MSLRQELALDHARDIHVCTVMPSSTDTPIFQHAANYTGRAAKALRPVYPAESVAETMVSCALRPRREAFVGNLARFVNLSDILAPGPTERLLATVEDRDQFYNDRPSPPSSGNLFEPAVDDGSVSGGWQRPGRLLLERLATAAVVGLLPLAAAQLWRRAPGDARPGPRTPVRPGAKHARD